MRYIDADALIKKIYPMGIGDGKYTINAKAVKLAIDNSPTADVVPKSEVEDLKDTNEHLAVMLMEAKTDVAREIFEEIERTLDNYHSACLPVGEIEAYTYYEGGLEEAIAELKKKYTEEKE